MVIGVGSLRKQSSGGYRFNPDTRRVTIQEYLTLDPVRANGIRTGDPRGFNKGRSSKFSIDSRIRQRKAGGHIGGNVVKVAIKTKTIVQKLFMAKMVSSIVI